MYVDVYESMQLSEPLFFLVIALLLFLGVRRLYEQQAVGDVLQRRAYASERLVERGCDDESSLAPFEDACVYTHDHYAVLRYLLSHDTGWTRAHLAVLADDSAFWPGEWRRDPCSHDVWVFGSPVWRWKRKATMWALANHDLAFAAHVNATLLQQIREYYLPDDLTEIYHPDMAALIQRRIDGVRGNVS